MSLYFVTGNQGKFKEAKQVIYNLEQKDIDLPEIQAIDPKEIIKVKLGYALKRNEGPLIVEDNSLYLDCLKGLPGPLIKWFLKTVGNDGLFEIAGRAENYKAKAAVMIGYAKNEDDINFFQGIVKGRIVAPIGDNGFGWDSIFQPEGYDKTYAEMTLEEKNGISMRRIAFEKLKNYLGGRIDQHV